MNSKPTSSVIPPTAEPVAKSLDMSFISAKIEERRKRWIQECKPWRYCYSPVFNTDKVCNICIPHTNVLHIYSQISASAVNNILKPRRHMNRPSSAAMKQEPIAEEIILNQSQQHSLSQVCYITSRV